MRIENGRLRMHLDERTGSIIRIADLASGMVHLHAVGEGRDDARLFRLMAPVERWSSRHVDSHTSPSPQVEQSSEAVTLRWPRLHANDEEAGICAEVRIELPPGKDEAIFTLRVKNHSGGDITDILFPWIGGWTGLGGKGQDVMVLGGHTKIDPHNFPINRGTTYSRWHQREFYSYPLGLYAPWVDLSGPAGGLSCINYQDVPRNVGFMVENMAGHGPGLRLGFGWTHFTLVRPGQSWESPPLAISVHDGDWHHTADRYTRWSESWYQPAPTPTWARTAVGWQNVFCRGFDGTHFRSLEALPEVARVGRKYGVNHLCVWDYMLLGNYAKMDDYGVLDYSNEEKSALRRVLRQVREEGTQTSALTNFRLVNPTSTLFREQAHDEVCRRYDGTMLSLEFCGSHNHPTMWTRHLGPMCHPCDPRIPSYRERTLRLVREYFDLGFTSLFYDQPFEGPSYHPGRGEDGPDGAHAGAVSLVHEARALCREITPEGILIGEFGDIFAAQSIDLWMSWYHGMDEAARAAYTLPQTIHSWVVDNDIPAATRAAALGLQLCLTTFGCEGTLADVPQLAEHVARLARLRETCAERLCCGRFRDTQGIDLATDSDIVAFAYDSAAGPAVVVAAPSEKGRAQVLVNRPAFTPSQSREGYLYRLDGAVETVGQTDKLDLELEGSDLVVWML